MSIFGKILEVFLAAGVDLGPIFIHSNQGVAILNAGEELVAEIASIFNPPTPAPVAPSAPAPPTTGGTTTSAPHTTTTATFSLTK